MVHEAPDLLCCSYFLRFCLKMENLLQTLIKLARDHSELSSDINSKLLQESVINQMQPE